MRFAVMTGYRFRYIEMKIMLARMRRGTMPLGSGDDTSSNAGIYHAYRRRRRMLICNHALLPGNGGDIS